MSICCYTINKYTGLLANLLYMILGMGIIIAAGLGLKIANPNSPEHTYFIESIVLGGMICMIVIFGCYGLFTDLLVVNIIFSTFILLILAVQYVQLDFFHPHIIYHRALSQLDNDWQQLENKPSLMQRIEVNLQANTAAKLNAHADLATLNGSYELATRREKIFSYCTIGLELFILIQTIVQTILIYRCRYQSALRIPLLPTARANHMDSRTLLLPEEV